jgi:hypothetical protein
MSVKTNLAKLYKTDFNKFCKLLQNFYGNTPDGFMLVLVDKEDDDARYFIIKNSLYNLNTISEDINEAAKQAALLKKYNLLV